MDSFRLEMRDGKQACVCSNCQAFYYLEAPSGFRHAYRCPLKKTPVQEKFNWQRNVLDQYKDLSEQEIKEKLRQKQLPFAILMENLLGDFNLGTVIRNANAFGAQEVFYLGEKKGYDVRGAVGTHHYTQVSFLKKDQISDLKQRYPVFIGIEQVANSVPLKDFLWPSEKFLILLGEEGAGLSRETLALCDFCVEIPQIGSVRSLNAGVASGIVMHDILNKIGPKG